MMLKALIQMALALGLVTMVPQDAGQIEAEARLPRAGGRVPSAFELTNRVYDPASQLTLPTAEPPALVVPESLGIATSAVSALVYDRGSATVLYQKNPDAIRSIGSITKLMTAHVALASGLDLEQQAAVREPDVRTGGHEYLFVDDEVTVRDLLRASLVGSDNSATMALMRLTDLGTEQFVERMNRAAQGLGMNQTQFVDPTGLSNRNRSTAEDIVRLLEAVLTNSEIQAATAEPVARITSVAGTVYRIPNTNELLLGYLNQGPYAIVGGKTGFLPQAGYCIALRFQENGAHDIFVVLLGSDSKEARLLEAKGLAQWAYDVYQWPDEL